MLRKLLFALIALNFNLSAMELTPEQEMLMTKGRKYANERKYDQAKVIFEKLFNESKKTSYAHIEAAESLSWIFLKGFKDYKEALRYAQYGYDTCEKLFAAGEDDPALADLFIKLIQDLGIVYQDGPNKSYSKALNYFELAYEKSLNSEPQVLRANSAYFLASMYSSIVGLDDGHEKTNKYLDEAIELGKKYRLINVVDSSNYLRKAIRYKKPVKIEFKDKTIKEIDMDALCLCSGKRLSDLLIDAESHQTKFILARALVQNPNNTIGSFYCIAHAMMITVWGESAYEAFGKPNDEEALQLNAHRRTISPKDPRPIIGVEFFEWDPSQHIFKYLCDDEDFFEGGEAGRRKRLFILGQNHFAPILRTSALVALAELNYLGLGGSRDLEKALEYLEEAFKNNTSKEAAIVGRSLEAKICLDLAIANQDSNPNLFIKYITRAISASAQQGAWLTQTCALAELEMFYRKKNSLKLSLVNINKILAINGIPIQFWQYYSKLKGKLEKILRLQESRKAKAQEAPAVPAKKERKETVPSPKTSSQDIPAPQELPQISKPVEKIEIEKTEPQEEEKVEIKTSQEVPVVSEEEEFDIDSFINNDKAESLLKRFDQSLAYYESNPKHAAYLKDASDILEKVKLLNIRDKTLQARMTESEIKLNAAFRNTKAEVLTSSSSSSSSTSSSASASAAATSAATVVLDLFDVENNISEAQKKRFDEIKSALAYDSRCCGAERIESSKYDILKIRLGEYRLLYIVNANFIGLLGIVNRDEGTYKKVDPKYKDKVKEYNDLAVMSSSQLSKRIEDARKLGRESYANVLSQLLQAIKNG